VDEVPVKMPERVTIKPVRIRFAESLRFPGEGKSAQGQSDPNTRLKSVVDGRQVNIPVPGKNRLTVRRDAGVKVSHLVD